MTPELTIAALHLLDRFTLTCMALQGQPWPAPPALPGRLHVCQDDPDEGDAFDVPSVAELAARLGLSRQGAWMRLRAYRKRPDPKKLLAPVQRPRGRLIDSEDTHD